MVVHRDTLIVQAAERYKLRTKLEANVLSRMPAASWTFEPGLNLMTFQSLAAAVRKDRTTALAKLKQVGGLVVDECHVAPADVYYSVLNAIDAEYRLGFSGTPLDRSDNRSLMAIAALGRVIYSISAKTLIDAGVLALPRVRIVTVKQERPASKAGGRRSGASAFADAYNAMIVGSAIRNSMVVHLAKSAPKPCMIFVKQIEHGKALKQMVEGQGLSCEFVWGTTQSQVRSNAIRRLDRGDTEVLIASVVFQEGVDVPGLESVIVASGGKSVIATLQRVGRGMRTNGGTKSEFVVYDLLDVGSPMLATHSRRRMNSYVREGYEVVLEGDDGSSTRYQPKLKTRSQRRAGVMPKL
jgi:superfamily II DNA or RNA helicase